MDSKTILLNDYLNNISLNNIAAGFSIHSACNTKKKINELIFQYNKFMYVKNGESSIEVGSELFNLKKGDLFLIPEGVLSIFPRDNQQKFSIYWCNFNAKVGILNFFDIINIPMCINMPQDLQLPNLFEELIKYFKGDKWIHSFKMKAALSELLAYYIESVPLQKITINQYSPTHELMNVIQYMEDNIEKDITVEELAELINFHPNYFIQIFNEMIGCPPIRYMNRIKLEKAKSLLKSTSFTIKKISEMVGFNDPGYFSKKFKAYTGLSPLEFRTCTTSIKS